jgi:plasmid stabilization system protein ParE
MPRVLRREAAKRDLIRQWVWYAENAGTDIADRFFRAVDSTLATLSSQPESGIQTFTNPHLLHKVRHFPVADGFERFLLFYIPLRNRERLLREGFLPGPQS